MELTQRQRQTLQGIVDGLTHKEIGYRYEMAGRTVSMHVAQLKRKFGVPSVAQIAVVGIVLELIDYPTKEQIIRRIEKK